MENLSQFTDTIAKAAEESCTPCLTGHLRTHSDGLPAVIARFQVACEWLGDSPESQDEFAVALAGFLTSAISMAVITGELMRRPGVRWIDENTEIALPVIHLSAS
jgi:hypothetical protein